MYVDIDTGELILNYRKEWMRNEDSCLDLVMNQFKRHPMIEDVKEEEKGDESFGTDISEE